MRKNPTCGCGKRNKRFILGKGEGHCRWGSLPGGMEASHAGKEKEFLFLVVFISSLTWRWGENPFTPPTHA
jgi:hypothetical protein